jgi:hypothetical protein
MPVVVSHPGTVAGTNWVSDSGTLADGVFTTNTSYDRNTADPPTDTLRCTNYGFAVSGTDTIDGIVVNTQGVGLSGGPDGFRFHVRLTKDGTNVIGDDLYEAKTGAGDENWTWGSASYLWGTTWTPAEINAATFGCIVYFEEHPDPCNRDVRIDEIYITIYSSSAGGSVIHVMRAQMKRIPEFVIEDGKAGKGHQSGGR